MNPNISKEIAERIVNHPAFASTLNQITNTTSSGNNSAIVTTSRNFASPHEETNYHFFRGRRRSRTPSRTHRRTLSGTPRSTHNINIKEVVLLDKPSAQYTVRVGSQKAFLTENGCLFNHVTIPSTFTEKEVYSFFEDLFSKPLTDVNTDENTKKFEIKIGVGNVLTKPSLQQGTELNAVVLKRVFGQKTIWLVPTKPILESESERRSCPEYEADNHEELNIDPVGTCLNCGFEVFGNLDVHNQFCQGGSSTTTTSTYSNIFDSSNNLYTPEELNKNERIEKKLVEENISFLQEMFTNASETCIKHALRQTNSLDDAVSMLVDGDGLGTVSKVLAAIQEKTVDARSEYVLKISRDNIWADGMKFYKTALGDISLLKKKFVVKFDNESGIDLGALKNEFFTLMFEKAKKELFETDVSNVWQCVPKRSGGNTHIFKIFGIIIAHSLLHRGPYFNNLAPWAVEILCDGEVSGQISVESIPLTLATGMTINLIKNLQNCNNDDDIVNLFNSSEAPGYEQIIGLSEWDQNVDITIENKSILIDMLVYEEVITRRSGKIKAIKEGLSMLGITEYLHLPIVKELFIGKPAKVTADRLISIIDWPIVTEPKKNQAIAFFNSFIKNSDDLVLIKLLKFITGFNDLSPLVDNGNFIEVDFVMEDFPKSSACLRIIHLPCIHSNEIDFDKNMKLALEIESEGYGEF